MIPIPPTALGPRCIPGPNDTATTPNKCLPGETGLKPGLCVPCLGTPGSDCSRCGNNWDGTSAFPVRADGAKGSDHAHAIRAFLPHPHSPGGGLMPSHSPHNRHTICVTGEGLRLRQGPRAGDIVKVPAGLAPGRYVLGWRCD